MNLRQLILHCYRMWTNPGYKVVYLYRIGHRLKGWRRRLFEPFFLHVALKHQIDIGLDMQVGRIWFPHHGPVVINAGATLGDNIIMHPCSLIGSDRINCGVPTIGNNVFIGHGSKIIGGCTIGDNVFIAPGAIITKSVSADCVMGGGY